MNGTLRGQGTGGREVVIRKWGKVANPCKALAQKALKSDQFEQSVQSIRPLVHAPKTKLWGATARKGS